MPGKLVRFGVRAGVAVAVLAVSAACATSPITVPSPIPATTPAHGYTAFSVVNGHGPTFFDGHQIDNAFVYGCSTNGGPIWMDLDWVGDEPAYPPAADHALPAWGFAVHNGYQSPLAATSLDNLLGGAAADWTEFAVLPEPGNILGYDGNPIQLSPGQCFTVSIISWYMNESIPFPRGGEVYFTTSTPHHLEYTLNWG